MNPEDLKKQADEEGIVHDDDVAPPMPCGDGCEGCESCTPEEGDTTPPETEQPPEEPELIKGLEAAKEAAAKKNEPEVRQAPPEDDPQLSEDVILQGLQIELTSEGDVKRNFYGASQNVTLMLGLVKVLEMEIEQRQKLQRGFMPSAEMTAMGGLARLMQNMGSVMVQIQGAMVSINETMKAGFDEAGQVESTVDAEPQQE